MCKLQTPIASRNGSFFNANLAASISLTQYQPVMKVPAKDMLFLMRSIVRGNVGFEKNVPSYFRFYRVFVHLLDTTLPEIIKANVPTTEQTAMTLALQQNVQMWVDIFEEGMHNVVFTIAVKQVRNATKFGNIVADSQFNLKASNMMRKALLVSPVDPSALKEAFEQNNIVLYHGDFRRCFSNELLAKQKFEKPVVQHTL